MTAMFRLLCTSKGLACARQTSGITRLKFPFTFTTFIRESQISLMYNEEDEDLARCVVFSYNFLNFTLSSEKEPSL